MRDVLVLVTEYAVLVIQSMAAVFIIVGTAQAFVMGLRAFVTHPTGHERREVWLRLARALVAALTFQLAADILETAVRTDWASIGHLGAIALIRTFLNYFLERDLREVRADDRDAIRAKTRASQE